MGRRQGCSFILGIGIQGKAHSTNQSRGIDTKNTVGVRDEARGRKQEKAYLLAKVFGSVASTTDNAKTTGVCDGSNKSWSRSHIHSREIRQENRREWTTRVTNYECFTYPASRTGCLIPKSSVIGVVMVAIVNSEIYGSWEQYRVYIYLRFGEV